MFKAPRNYNRNELSFQYVLKFCDCYTEHSTAFFLVACFDLFYCVVFGFAGVNLLKNETVVLVTGERLMLAYKRSLLTDGGIALKTGKT